MVTRFYIENAQALDPITVIIEDMQVGVGRVTIICWGEVWTSFWGGMNGDSVAVFLLRCNRDYIAENLWNGQKHTKIKAAYLLRIVDAVKAGLAVAAERAEG